MTPEQYSLEKLKVIATLLNGKFKNYTGAREFTERLFHEFGLKPDRSHSTVSCTGCKQQPYPEKEDNIYRFLCFRCPEKTTSWHTDQIKALREWNQLNDSTLLRGMSMDIIKDSTLTEKMSSTNTGK